MEQNDPPQPAPDPVSAQGLTALGCLYARLDQEIAQNAGKRCATCGDCCHFESAGHRLYASTLERSLLARQARPTHPDASQSQLARGERCPFQVKQGCAARQARTLGCRLFFCQDNAPEEWNVRAEAWHQELKRLHDQLGVAWDYRPLLPL
ncbi:MAG: hypothetical protein LBU79_03375 [Planctomycetota bacterium]|nr:hypothetical protein [Planctomycetota bacterium]